MPAALVRPPADSFRQAISGHQPRPPIDVDRARKQHSLYCTALLALGLELIELPPNEEYPDSCFVQDTAVIYDDLAILGRFGAESRQGEQDLIRPVLQEHKRVVEIRPPGTLEGGDVLIIGTRLFVGLSARTNRAGFSQLRDLLELAGATVRPLPVAESLHLLSDCTYLGRGVLLATEDWIDHPAFAGLDVAGVPLEEAYAANALAVGRHVIVPSGYPLTSKVIRARGFSVLPVPLSEFAKADGGATCLSLVLGKPPTGHEYFPSFPLQENDP